MLNDKNAGSLFLATLLDREAHVSRVKDQKVGEGTYAVVYRGSTRL